MKSFFFFFNRRLRVITHFIYIIELFLATFLSILFFILLVNAKLKSLLKVCNIIIILADSKLIYNKQINHINLRNS